MTQADRDRLIALKKAHQRLITQREAAVELGLSIRQVQRLLVALADFYGPQRLLVNVVVSLQSRDEAVKTMTPSHSGSRALVFSTVAPGVPSVVSGV